MSGKYEDIIHLPHHISPKRARMAMTDRGAQFSPFAALTGFEAAIAETARLTDRKIELDENEKALLNEKLRIIGEDLESGPEIRVTHFRQDLRKAGGAYVQKRGKVKKLDACYGTIVFTDGEAVRIGDILDIQLE